MTDTAADLEKAARAVHEAAQEVERFSVIAAAVSKDPEQSEVWRKAVDGAEMYGRVRADAEAEFKRAQQAHQQTINDDLINSVGPAVVPLDIANHENVRAFAAAAAKLVEGAITRDQVASSFVASCRQTQDPRVSDSDYMPSVDGVPLFGTKSNVVVEACRVMERTFRQLSAGYLASQCAAGAASGNRLPAAKPIKEIV